MKNKSLTENFTELSSVLKSYLDARINLWKLTLIEKMTKVGTYFVTMMVIVTTLLFVLLLLSFAFSFWYGEEYGNLYKGFLIASIGYLALVFILFLLRKAIFSNQIVKHISEIFFDNEEN